MNHYRYFLSVDKDNSCLRSAPKVSSYVISVFFHTKLKKNLLFIYDKIFLQIYCFYLELYFIRSLHITFLSKELDTKD
jgi:hypothetical protein